MLLGIIKHNMPKPVKMTLGDMSTVATIAGCMAGLPRSRVLDITERGIDLTWQEYVRVAQLLVRDEVIKGTASPPLIFANRTLAHAPVVARRVVAAREPNHQSAARPRDREEPSDFSGRPASAPRGRQ